MEQWIEHFMAGRSLPVLLVIIAVTLYLLGKGADWLVEEAVALSVRWGVPKVLIGATIVSLGTTTPEAAVSVLAAIKGAPDLALGNAVGSVICDTGLILGLAAIIAPLPLNRRLVNRQGWLQVGAGFLLVFACLPFGSLNTTFMPDKLLTQVEAELDAELNAGVLPPTLEAAFAAQDARLPEGTEIHVLERGFEWHIVSTIKPRDYLVRKTDGVYELYLMRGGNLPRFVGFLFLGLLGLYMWQTIRWSRLAGSADTIEEADTEFVESGNLFTLAKLVFAIFVVVASSWVLIPAVRETAVRMHVPQGIIAATLVAFGTSLPELVTAVTAAWRGHGELAVGNVIGADILNVLFVAGAAASVTAGGLMASAHFFRILFPVMLSVLVVFRVGIFLSGDQLKRPFGFLLVGTYLLYLIILSYTNLMG